MATWYVRPDTSHSGTRNGTSYATAWGGWTAIVWGGAGVVGGDTLYVCGSHAYASAISIGAHGGSAEGTRCTIRGDYVDDPGSITFSSTAYLSSDRAWTTVRNLAITAASSNAIFMSAAATNSKYLDNDLVGTNGTNPLISLYAINGQNHSDILFDGNSLTGTCLSGIRWLCSDSTAVSTLTRVTITNNTFDALTVTEGAINMRAENDTSTSSIITDLIIDDNVFNDISYTCIRVGSDFTTPFGLCKGLKIRDNTFNNSGNAGASGGGIAPQSWGTSSTAGFGFNEISGNVIQGMRGVTGGVNAFDSELLIQNNLIEDCTSTTIDANGVLLDIGCANCTVRWNEINTCLGKEAVVNSGYAVMVLAATNIDVYGNIGAGNRNGVHIGAAGSGQSMDVFNNTFTDCIEYAVYANASADLANCTVRNNIFTGIGYKVFDATATAWTGENYNVFYGFASGTSNHTLGAQDQSANPSLRADYMPIASAVRSAGTTLGGADYYGKEFPGTPTIGAVQYQPAKTMTTRTVTTRTAVTRSVAAKRVATV